MVNKYYILNSTQYNTHRSNIEYDPVWNVAETECIIEIISSYDIPEVLQDFENSNAVQDYINDPIRIDEWYQPDISEIP